MRDYAALLRFLAERNSMPFAWGSDANDCVSFVGAAVAAQVGLNPFADLSWSTEAEGYAVIDRVGGLMAGVSDRLRRVTPGHAERGDVAGVMSGNIMGLMIVETATLVGPGLTGMVRRPRADMRFAWAAK